MNSDSTDPSDSPPPAWLDQPEMKRLVLGELTQRATKRRRRRTVAATGIALLLASVGAWRLLPEPRATVALTAPAFDTLPDGSVVQRKDGATYSVQFEPDVRRVILTHGTAHFEVTKNPARPFIVTAGNISVRAVGTAFSVELAPKAVEVLVTEGRVAVAPSVADPATAKPTAVDAGSGVRVELARNNQRPMSVEPVDVGAMEQKLAWRARLLELSGTSLGEVVKTLNRHNRVQFSIADAELEKIKLSGVIRTDRIAGVVELLEEEGVRVERQGDRQIVLRQASKE